MTDTAPPRAATEIDQIADDFVGAYAALSPIMATYLGIPGHDEEYDDLSPAGHEDTLG